MTADFIRNFVKHPKPATTKKKAKHSDSHRNEDDEESGDSRASTPITTAEDYHFIPISSSGILFNLSYKTLTFSPQLRLVQQICRFITNVLAKFITHSFPFTISLPVAFILQRIPKMYPYFLIFSFH